MILRSKISLVVSNTKCSLLEANHMSRAGPFGWAGPVAVISVRLLNATAEPSSYPGSCYRPRACEDPGC